VRPGNQTSSDGSFDRGSGIQVARAVVLLLVALAVGVVLLHHSPSAASASGPKTTSVAETTTTKKSTSTTKPAGGVTTSAPPVTTPIKTPQEVKVLVANGTGGQVSHLAGTISTKLKTLGYNTLAPIDATTTVTTSVIYYQTGFDREAEALAQALALPTTAPQALPNPPPVANLQGAEILVLAGPDLASGSATPSGGTTSGGTTGTTTRTTVHTTTTAVKP